MGIEDKLDYMQRKINILDDKIRGLEGNILNLMTKDKVFTLLLSQNIEFYSEKVQAILEEMNK